MLGFSIPIFFVTFREATEASIVVSVLLTFVYSAFKDDRAARSRLARLVWGGTAAGILISFLIGTAFIVIWFKYATNLWQSAESLWEGCFSLLASVLLTVMAVAFLKSESLQSKWHRKLSAKLAKHEEFAAVAGNRGRRPSDLASITASRRNSTSLTFNNPPAVDENSDEITTVSVSDDSTVAETTTEAQAKRGGGGSALFWIPFITVLREGLEGMVFLGGISISEDPGHIPLAAIAGLICGCAIGYAVYRTGSSVKLSSFFLGAAIFLCFLAAGLMAKATEKFEMYQWAKGLGVVDADNAKAYNVLNSVWHLDCCNPNDPNAGGWQLFSAILGYTNSASIATVTVYSMYWIALAILLALKKLVLDPYKRRRKEAHHRSASAQENGQSRKMTSTLLVADNETDKTKKSGEVNVVGEEEGRKGEDPAAQSLLVATA